MNLWWDAALWLLVLWSSALVFQIADLGTAWFDLRSARTRNVQFARRRTHEIFWVVPLAALTAVLAAFGVAWAVVLVVDSGWRLGAALLVALAVIIVITVGLLVGLVRVLTSEVQSYAVLRFRVVDAKKRKVTRDELARWRADLATIDAREAQRHENVARWLRLIPIAFGVLSTVAVWVAIATDAPVAWPLLGLAAIIPPVLSVVLATRAARLSLRARAAWAIVVGRQREKLVQALDELERRTNRGVAGLTERVNRALSILREQQQQ